VGGRGRYLSIEDGGFFEGHQKDSLFRTGEGVDGKKGQQSFDTYTDDQPASSVMTAYLSRPAGARLYSMVEMFA
jgi:hypothetical protein